MMPTISPLCSFPVAEQVGFLGQRGPLVLPLVDPSVLPVREKSGSLIYRLAFMNHQKTHQTNPIAQWYPIDAPLTPWDPCPTTNNRKRQTMTNDKQRQTTNNEKWQRRTNDDQWQTTNNDKIWQMTNNKQQQTTTNNDKRQTTNSDKLQTMTNKNDKQQTNVFSCRPTHWTPGTVNRNQGSTCGPF